MTTSTTTPLNHLSFPDIMPNSIDTFRTNYSSGQSLALSTITNNYNNMHSIYNTASANQSDTNNQQTTSNHQQHQLNEIENASQVFYLHQLPFDTRTNETILIARANVEFSRGAFRNLYRILEENIFSIEFHTSLQKVWHEAHYKESEKSRNRKLCAVDKYRLRKKFNLPKTIWDGDEYVYCFKEKSRQTLKNCYLNNK